MNIKLAVKFMALGACLALLDGCATEQALKPVQNPALAWQNYSHKLYLISNWQATGEIGIRDANQAISANFAWQQVGDQFVIRLSGPLNLGAQVLQGGPGKISLDSGKGQVVEASSAEQLMQQQLGWSMPVEGLVNWIRALPLQNVKYSKKIDETGAMTLLSQQNWAIHYQSYSVVNGLPLPHKIIMTQGPWRIVIVVNHWQLS
ncbi:MAG: lipoprotein insertase outer membrane protein LolB [Gammaproteobacteria bacterium]|nr:lipoprotein insertase outer membrane protein LolB [Gammaproteobacteria bacterium]